MSCESQRCQLTCCTCQQCAEGNSTRPSAKIALRASLERLEQGQVPTVIELMSILSNVSDYTYVANDTESEKDLAERS